MPNVALDSVFIVYHNVIGDCGSLFTYAVCQSLRQARKARGKVSGFKKDNRYFTEDPASNPYATEILILPVRLDRLYTLGVRSRASRSKLDTLEVIL